VCYFAAGRTALAYHVAGSVDVDVELPVAVPLSALQVRDRLARRRRRRRLAVLEEHCGVLTGAYGADYLMVLRGDWPA